MSRVTKAGIEDKSGRRGTKSMRSNFFGRAGSYDIFFKMIFKKGTNAKDEK